MKLAILDRLGSLQQVGGEDAMVAAADWQPQTGVLEAIAQLNRGGWQVALATNQPGLGRGSLDVNELNALHMRMQRDLLTAGARIEAIFFCPHTPEEGCECRKPAPGLLQQLASRYGAQPHEVVVVGQEACHLQAGAELGSRLIWVNTEECTAPAPAGLPDVLCCAGWPALAEALAPAVLPPAPPGSTPSRPV